MALPGKTLSEKLLRNSVKDGDCLRWTATTNQKGYGRLWWSGRLQSVHRLAYEVFVGDIPDGYEVDHLCRIRDCVNPKHLQAVTREENVRRALPFYVRSHCKRGHEFTADNVYVNPKYGIRACRECKRMHNRRCKERLAAMGGRQ